MSHITTQQAADLAGISKRHLQRLLTKGGEVPGASRTAGGHWQIEDGPAFRRWAKGFEKWDGKPRQAALNDLELGTWTGGLRASDVKDRGPRFSKLGKRASAEEVALAVVEDLDESVREARRSAMIVEARLNVAAAILHHLKTKKGHRFSHWVRQHIPKLHPKVAKWISTPGRTSTRELVIPMRKSEGHTRRDHAAYAWIKWAAKIPKSFSVDRAKGMDEIDRLVALKHLGPIKDLIARLENPPVRRR